MHKHKHGNKMQTKPEAREPVVSKRLSERFDIPQDIIAKAPMLLAYGNNRLCIDNYHHRIYRGEHKNSDKAEKDICKRKQACYSLFQGR